MLSNASLDVAFHDKSNLIVMTSVLLSTTKIKNFVSRLAPLAPQGAKEKEEAEKKELTTYSTDCGARTIGVAKREVTRFSFRESGFLLRNPEYIKQFWVGLMDGDGSIQVNH